MTVLLLACTGAKPPAVESATDDSGAIGDSPAETATDRDSPADSPVDSPRGDSASDSTAPAGDPLLHGDYPSGGAASESGDRPEIGDADGDGLDELYFSDGTARDSDARLWIVRRDLDADTREEIHLIDPGGVAPEWGGVGAGHVFVYAGDANYVFTGVPADGTSADAALVRIPGAQVSVGADPGDLDGDGADDLVLTVDGEDGLYVLSGPLPSGEVSPDSARTRVTESLSSYSFGDFDGDGAADMLAKSGVSGVFSVLFGPFPAGSGSLEELGALALEDDYPYTAGGKAVGDLDGDGADEVVRIGSYGLWMYSGIPRTGEMTPTVWLRCTPVTLEYLHSADLDGDGRNNLVIRSRDGWDEFQIWRDAPTFDDVCGLAYAVWAYGDESLDWSATARLGGGRASILFGQDEGLTYIREGVGSAGADLDRDGWGDNDCDDDDRAVHPAAAEHADGVDEDCDGVVDDGADRVELLATADIPGEQGNVLGKDLVAWDDDGDGEASLLAMGLRDYGSYSVWLLDAGDTVPDARAERWSGTLDGAVVLGDLDGDGIDELALGETAAYALMPGPLSDALALEDDLSLVGLEYPGDLGFVGSPGDLDGDGLDELVTTGSDPDGVGTAWVWLGGTATWEEATVWATFTGLDGAPTVPRLGDLDGDGADDLAFGDTDRLTLYLDITAGESNFYDYYSRTTAGGASRAARADLDADGTDELYLSDDGEVRRFELPLVEGFVDPVGSLTSEEGTDFGLGSTMVAVGDRLFLGEPSSDANVRRSGRLWMFDAPFALGATTANAAVGWEGPPVSSLAYALTIWEGQVAVGIPELAGDEGFEGGVALLTP